MKLDLYRVVELFRKSFSISLSDREKEELDDVLQDDYLKEAYDQLSDETFVLDKFREFDIYEYRPAFNKLKVYRQYSGSSVDHVEFVGCCGLDASVCVCLSLGTSG